MNMKTFFCAAALALAVFSLPSGAAPQQTTAQPAAAASQMDGIISSNCRYTILTVKAMSYRDSVSGQYDHTVVLRFHRDDSKRVDIKVLAPGEKRDGWGINDEWGNYCTVSGNEEHPQAKLHYVLQDEGANDLQLHVLNLGKISVNKGAPTCTAELAASSYTYAIGGGRTLFIYEFADTAVITGSNK